VYQTDLPSYARAYRLGRAGEAFAWRWLRGIHNDATRALAPSTATATGLLTRGIGNVWLWGRGVDTQRFNPARRSEALRTALLAPDGTALTPDGTALTPDGTALTPDGTALTPDGTALTPDGTALTPDGTALTPDGTALTPDGTALTPDGTALTPDGRARAPGSELLVGYVGRLATEKRVELLAGITALDGVRLVIVGAGPAEAMLRQHIPAATFLASSASGGVMSWRPSTPASTCSSTAGRMRRSGRRCRRPPRAGFRWWLRPPGGRLTWLRTG
jgi:glycosyltransferase involved in cell wall biosynthesis